MVAARSGGWRERVAVRQVQSGRGEGCVQLGERAAVSAQILEAVGAHVQVVPPLMPADTCTTATHPTHHTREHTLI